MVNDVIVVGGGPAGMAAAIAAKQESQKVVLIEKNKKLGLKMSISGGGRCNFTNTLPIDEFITNIPGNGNFLYSVFNIFSNVDLINFIEDTLNIRVKFEDDGRVFPLSDNSETLIGALEKHIKLLDINIIYKNKVKKILVDKQKVTGVLLEDNQIINGKTVILTTGGLSYPRTGSDGEGHRIAKELGHNITVLFPSLVPLISNDIVIKNKELQGLSFNNIGLYLYNKDGECIKKEFGDLIITHFGISGPAVLRLSRIISIMYIESKKIPLKLLIDFIPQKTEAELFDEINDLIKKYPRKYFNNSMKDLLPDKLLKYIIKSENIEFKRMNELNEKEIKSIINRIKKFQLYVSDTKPLKEAVITGGGVNIKEVNPKTMGSKLIKGLFFAGELLDLDAYTGGYNIQIAFSTGYVAGLSAGSYCADNF